MNFPTLEEITPNIRWVSVFYNNVYQYTITNEGQLNNLRLWAMHTKQTHLVRFVWNGSDIFLTETGDLTNWPADMFNNTVRQLANLIRLKRNEGIEGELFVK